MSQENTQVQDQKPWALVTGASAGIGAEFCRQLAARGYQLVLVARREDKLQDMADELKTSYRANSIIIPADLSHKGASEAICRRLDEENIEVEYLVNNAGFGLPGSFHVPDWQEHHDFIQVMMTAVCELTYHLLPGMRERRRGHIINVASVAGLIPSSAGHTLYGASKVFLIKFTESLILENEANGVKITALCPGFTYSEFHDVNNTRHAVSQLPSYMWLESEMVVSEALAAMSEDKVKSPVIPGRIYKIIVWINRYLPWLGNMIIKRNASNYRITE
ncbi:MAG: SDR family NAD(P)-dependent oxidoreductase [Xanthomonadales bacterium]|nr:SDR family NAD(P)-dependent oxidoreductase [Xanthomonadales bacterium]